MRVGREGGHDRRLDIGKILARAALADLDLLKIFPGHCQSLAMMLLRRCQELFANIQFWPQWEHVSQVVKKPSTRNKKITGSLARNSEFCGLSSFT